MTRRYRHRTSTRCPMLRVGVACLAFGREGDCPLCSLVDLDHAATVASLGTVWRAPALADAEVAWCEHMHRRTDGGWRPYCTHVPRHGR